MIAQQNAASKGGGSALSSGKTSFLPCLGLGFAVSAGRRRAMLGINGITVRLGGRTILDRATAAIPPGGRVGLIGRNGAGKSTLMKVMIGGLDPDEGSIDMPRSTRLGYIAQDAPSGAATPAETVLAADVERDELLSEAETCTDPDRLGDIHERLLAIDAYTAPSRAARILTGLGFDEDMQNQPLDSFSGGWKMRVALAALLYSAPDVLLLDEPSNHLDLEATLWLENFLKGYPATVVVISHERDLLNNVVDNILHLQGGKLTLYPGGMTVLNASGLNARHNWHRPRHPKMPSAPDCKIMFRATAHGPPPPNKHSPAPRCWPKCSRLQP